MSKKELAIATIHAQTGKFLSNEIKKIFKDKIKINRFSFDDRSIEKGIDCNLIIILEEEIFEALKKYVKDEVEIIIAKRTITKKGFNKIINLDEGTRAMLVNVDTEMAMETISLVYQLGAKNLELTPVYPGMEKIPNLDLAITPGEKDHVPDSAKKIIDIGERVLDISTIFDLAVKMEMEYLLEEKEARNFFDKIMPVSFGLEKIMGKKNRLESQLNILLQSIDVGIIGVNRFGVITSYNKSAEEITAYSSEKVLGEDANKIFNKIPFQKVLNDSKAVVDKIIKLDNSSIIATINPIIKFDSIYGAVAIIKKLSDTVKKQNKLRAQLIDKGHVAQYTFKDIIGKSKTLQKAKKIAKRMADSNSTILLTGESGTGKELFAQAIHNSSTRKKQQFVATNCATFPKNLLESELFGYEKGAFTGAKKDGKMGLFELAHQGTLFLDEISEMPFELQSRLLRVLEQKEIMRIGGDSVININVRIIAATNKDLKKMVEKGEFREDLYYRLSVLPLKIAPLRDRIEDIFSLINSLKKELSANFKLSSNVRELFADYYWPGNVRELRNYLEFFANLQKDIIKKDDLPFTFEENNGKEYFLSNEEKEIINSFEKSLTYNQLKHYSFVMQKLKEKNKKGEPSGRRSLAKEAVKNNIFISEQEIRKILKDLESYKLVNIKRGRGGSKITEKGINFLPVLIDKID